MSRVQSNAGDVLKAAQAAGLEQINTLLSTMSAIASKNSPVATGNNRDNIATKTGMEGGKPVGRVYTQSGQSGWLEIGTSKMPARPYIAPAPTKRPRT